VVIGPARYASDGYMTVAGIHRLLGDAHLSFSLRFQAGHFPVDNGGPRRRDNPGRLGAVVGLVSTKSASKTSFCRSWFGLAESLASAEPPDIASTSERP
jgi:hypothetical protein